jgi:hypothetical protein
LVNVVAALFLGMSSVSFSLSFFERVFSFVMSASYAAKAAEKEPA